MHLLHQCVHQFSKWCNHTILSNQSIYCPPYNDGIKSLHFRMQIIFLHGANILTMEISLVL